MVLSIVRAYAG